MTRVVAALAITATTVAFGLAGCTCGSKAKAQVQSAPDAEVEKRMKELLRSAVEAATEMCGFPVAGVEATKVEIKSQILGTGSAHVTGTPIPFDGGATDASASDVRAGARDGGEKDAGLNLKRAAVCAGVVAFTIRPVLDSDGVTAKDWTMTAKDLDVVDVETEGVDRDEHLRRHHHHHHHH